MRAARSTAANAANPAAASSPSPGAITPTTASLLEHLGIERAHLIGGCMGCSCVMAFGVAYPGATLSMILWWPVGGAKYRMKAHQRFADQKAFNADARGGPWASPIRTGREFAEAFARQDAGQYAETVEKMRTALFDRDTSPGAQPEDLLKLDIPALIIPGRDESHATSAARYLEECLPKAEYWDALPPAQTEAASAPRVTDFLRKVEM